MQDAGFGLPRTPLLGTLVTSLFSREWETPGGVIVSLMTEGQYLAPSAVALILAGVLVLALLSSLVLVISSLERRRATEVFWLLLLAIWLVAVLIGELIRPAGWW
jgi:hypothetical protein